MTQAYSNPERQDDPHALPDVEVFYQSAEDTAKQLGLSAEDGEAVEGGWFYWYCFPGCMPDSDPVGPFVTEADAIAAAQEAGSHMDPADLA